MLFVEAGNPWCRNTVVCALPNPRPWGRSCPVGKPAHRSPTAMAPPPGPCHLTGRRWGGPPVDQVAANRPGVWKEEGSGWAPAKGQWTSSQRARAGPPHSRASWQNRRQRRSRPTRLSTQWRKPAGWKDQLQKERFMMQKGVVSKTIFTWNFQNLGDGNQRKSQKKCDGTVVISRNESASEVSQWEKGGMTLRR